MVGAPRVPDTDGAVTRAAAAWKAIASAGPLECSIPGRPTSARAIHARRRAAPLGPLPDPMSAAAHLGGCWWVSTAGLGRRAGRAGSIGRPGVRLGDLPLTGGRSQAALALTCVGWRSDLSWRRSFLILHRVTGRGPCARTTPPLASTDRRIRSAQRRCAVGLVCRRNLRGRMTHRRRQQRREDRLEAEMCTVLFGAHCLVCVWVTDKAKYVLQMSARRLAPLQLAAAWWLRTRVPPSVLCCAHRPKAPPLACWAESSTHDPPIGARAVGSLPDTHEDHTAAAQPRRARHGAVRGRQVVAASNWCRRVFDVTKWRWVVGIVELQFLVAPERAWSSCRSSFYRASAAGESVIKILAFFAWCGWSACIDRPRELSKHFWCRPSPIRAPPLCRR